MLEELKKSIDKGLEYAFMTGDKIAQAAKEIAKENKLTKEEAKKLLDHLVKKSDEARKTIESDLHTLVINAMKKMDIPTKEEYSKLEARIKKLEGYHKQSARPKPATKQAKPSTQPVTRKKK